MADGAAGVSYFIAKKKSRDNISLILSSILFSLYKFVVDTARSPTPKCILQCRNLTVSCMIQLESDSKLYFTAWIVIPSHILQSGF